jgi:hypothetical protein
MSSEIVYKGQDVPRAISGHLNSGSGWRLVATKGERRFFVGTLKWTQNFGETRIAVFTVPKAARSKARAAAQKKKAVAALHKGRKRTATPARP